MGDDRVERLGLEGREAAEQLGGLRRAHWQVLQVAQRRPACVAAPGSRDGVGHAVRRVEPIGRRGLGAARQRRLNVGRRVAFRQPDDAGELAVEVDLQRGRAGSAPGGAGRRCRARDGSRARTLSGIGVVGLQIGADDLHVERGRRPEVEDLADDVGRQKREGGAGKVARQPLAPSVLTLVLGRDLALFEGDRACRRRTRRSCRNCRRRC